MSGDHGQIVRQHVILAAKQEQEHVHTIRIILVNHSPNKKVATFKNAVTIGHRGQIALRVFKQEPEAALAHNKTSKKVAKLLL